MARNLSNFYIRNPKEPALDARSDLGYGRSSLKFTKPRQQASAYPYSMTDEQEEESEKIDDVEIDDNEGAETEPVDETLVDAADDVDKEKEEEIKPEESEEKELKEEPIPKDEEPNTEDTSSQSADSSPVTTE